MMETLSLNDFKDVQISMPWGHIAGRWYGNRSVRPILAIHGWLDNLGTFDRLIPLLPNYLGVLCIDLPGHGCSSSLPAGMRYSSGDWALIVARIVEEYKWPKVSLMGHSLGGAVSYIYATLAPDVVDLIISLDVVHPYLATVEVLENDLAEEVRTEEATSSAPPCYTMDRLRRIVNRGSNNSVPPELAHHLVYRSLSKSKLYSEMFYVPRDNRIKYLKAIPMDSSLANELALRIRDIPYLIIRANDSNATQSDSNETISTLRQYNPYFEYHTVPGGHYVHLVNPELCAQYIVPFLKKYRPASSKL